MLHVDVYTGESESDRDMTERESHIVSAQRARQRAGPAAAGSRSRRYSCKGVTERNLYNSYKAVYVSYVYCIRVGAAFFRAGRLVDWLDADGPRMERTASGTKI